MKITERTIHDTVRSFMRPLRARLENVVSRGVVRSLGDATGLARGQASAGADNVADDIEFVGPPGLSYRPLSGAEAIMWAIGASADHILGFIFDRRMRLKDVLAEGEVALHIGVAGQRVRLLRDGSVEVRAGDDVGAFVVLKPNGDVVAVPGPGGGVYLGDDGATKKVALADELNTLRSAFNSHTHPTAPPGVVSTPTVVPAVIPVPVQPGSNNVYAKG